MSGEFALIDRFFRPLAGPGALNLEDDAGVFAPPPGRDLVIAADAMVAGIHFLSDDPADLVARKLLRVNLSDLAAMGATPLGYLLTVSVPRDTSAAWFAAFASGLAHDQAEFGIALIGGDTTRTPGPVSLSLTVLGSVLPGHALRRSGARPGDGIWVTGTIGDGALGLLAARGEIADPDGTLAGRYRLPQPRLVLGMRLHGVASAVMDISDGLVQDLGHLCRASGVVALVSAGRVPLSGPARGLGHSYVETCLTGGDDYELLLTVPVSHETELTRRAVASDTAVTRIGVCVAGEPAVSVRGEDGREWPLSARGWDHFAVPAGADGGAR